MMNSLEEDRFNEFDSHERISGVDIQAIKNTIVFNMTGRQIILTGIALIVTAGILFLLHATVGLRNTYLILIPMPFSIPFLLFAFYQPLGMNLEDWLQIWYSNNIKSMPVRKLFSENAYERALRAAEQQSKNRKESGRGKKIEVFKNGKGKKKDRFMFVQ